MPLRVAFASDHAGVDLRLALAREAMQLGHEAVDLGPPEGEAVDYPDRAVLVGRALQDGGAQVGVLVCGTGTGMAIAANKLSGVRAAVCRSEYEARMARGHNDANVLCLGQRVTGPGLAAAILEAFLATSFEGGRHARRIEKITALERGVARGALGGDP